MIVVEKYDGCNTVVVETKTTDLHCCIFAAIGVPECKPAAVTIQNQVPVRRRLAGRPHSTVMDVIYSTMRSLGYELCVFVGVISRVFDWYRSNSKVNIHGPYIRLPIFQQELGDSGSGTAD